jgi:hypothetical protein
MRCDSEASSTALLIGGTSELRGAPETRFFTAANTTAQPSEAMRIDSSGNVQIGTTAANGYNFRVAGSIPAQFVSNSTAASISYGAVAVYRQTKANNDGVGAAFQLNNSSDAQTEYGYIGAFITSNTTGAGGLLFCTDTGRTERMRITSAGELLVGSTSISGAKVNISATAAGGRTLYLNKGTGDTTDYFIVADTTTANRFLVLGSGDVQNTNNS